jgi:hypothetical protein
MNSATQRNGWKLVAGSYRQKHHPLRPADHVDHPPSTPVALTADRRALRAPTNAFRWECPCQTPAVLLATYEPGGKINIKVRDRYWHLYGFGTVQAVCPRCAAEHILDLSEIARRDPELAKDRHPT